MKGTTVKKGREGTREGKGTGDGKGTGEGKETRGKGEKKGSFLPVSLEMKSQFYQSILH